jgi:hypothetical protein
MELIRPRNEVLQRHHSPTELWCRLGDLSPRLPGIFRFFAAPAEGMEAGTAFYQIPPRPFCCLQAPVGARVASQLCPILRWSKWDRSLEFNCASTGSVSRFRFLGGYRCGKCQFGNYLRVTEGYLRMAPGGFGGHQARTHRKGNCFWE